MFIKNLKYKLDNVNLHFLGRVWKQKKAYHRELEY